MDINTISKQNKEKLVFDVGKMYQDSLKLAYENDTRRIEDGKGVYICLRMKQKVDTILNELRLEYAFIIRKEFLQKNDENWYQKYFDIDEYKVYKKGAIDEFLHCLYG